MTSHAPGQYALDAAHSTVTFQHKTMWGLVTVKGAFTSVTGDGKINADGTAVGVIELRAASIDTHNDKRDTHLRSAAFFDAERFPVIKFDVTAAKPRANGTVDVEGLLTVRGVTRPQTLIATLVSSEPAGITLDARFDVDRSAFGITWNQIGMIRGQASVAATLRFARG